LAHLSDRLLTNTLRKPSSDGRESFYWLGLLISMQPLKKPPSPIVMRPVVTSPVNEPSLRLSTRSLALTLPCTVPRTTTSPAVISANTCACQPTVTRQSSRLIEPATLPSMYKDSEPITSPLIRKLWPIVAGSAAARNAGGA